MYVCIPQTLKPFLRVPVQKKLFENVTKEVENIDQIFYRGVTRSTNKGLGRLLKSLNVYAKAFRFLHFFVRKSSICTLWL